jgi:hypothetical protein
LNSPTRKRLHCVAVTALSPGRVYDTMGWSADRADHHRLGGNMAMHTPSAWTFWLSVVLVVIAVIGTFVQIPYISLYALWVAIIGYVILLIGCTVKTA